MTTTSELVSSSNYSLGIRRFGLRDKQVLILTVVVPQVSMSSLRVRTKNKLMMALGAAKPSTNVAFDLVYSDFKSTVQRLETLELALKTYAASMKTFHAVGSLVVGAIEGLSAGNSSTASYQRESVGFSNTQQIAGDARVACTDMDMIVLRETYERLEHEVLMPVKSWLQNARSLQNQAIAFQKQKALYDHYSLKVVTLHEARMKRASTGRSDETKKSERILRNQQKLAVTTQQYMRQSDAIIRDLRGFVVSQHAALAPLLRRVLRGWAIYAERMHEATGRISALIENSVVEGGNDGMLDHASPRTLPHFVNVDTAVTAARLSGDMKPAMVFSKMSANTLTPSSVAIASSPPPSVYTMQEFWNAFPTASAPSIDPFMSKEWSSSQYTA